MTTREARRSTTRPLNSIAAVLMIIGLYAPACAQQREMPVWPGKAPGSESWTQKEADFTMTWASPADLVPVRWKLIRNVVTPGLTIFLPESSTATGTGIIICPGGGFRFLSWESEGTRVAQWLAAHGIAAFVLKYRLIASPSQQKEFEHAMASWQAQFKAKAATERSKSVLDDEQKDIAPLAIADARQAIRIVRQHAAQWGLSRDRIGIMGFSAGGVVTMGVALEHDADSRPNFAAPIYGGDVGGRPIPPDAPPLFLLVAQDDPLEERVSVKMYSDWHDAGHSAELHVFAKGGHGFGMIKQNAPVDHWIDLFADWLEWQGLMKRPSPPQAAAAY
jgi:acetyl esterase/lipase